MGFSGKENCWSGLPLSSPLLYEEGLYVFISWIKRTHFFLVVTGMRNHPIVPVQLAAAPVFNLTKQVAAGNVRL